MILFRNDPRPVAIPESPFAFNSKSISQFGLPNAKRKPKTKSILRSQLPMFGLQTRAKHNVHIDISFFGMMKCARKVPTILKPSFCQRRTAESLVETTKLNCIARKPRRRASLRQMLGHRATNSLATRIRSDHESRIRDVRPASDWLGRRIYVPRMRPLLSAT